MGGKGIQETARQISVGPLCLVLSEITHHTALFQWLHAKTLIKAVGAGRGQVGDYHEHPHMGISVPCGFEEGRTDALAAVFGVNN